MRFTLYGAGSVGGVIGVNLHKASAEGSHNDFQKLRITHNSHPLWVVKCLWTARRPKEGLDRLGRRRPVGTLPTYFG